MTPDLLIDTDVLIDAGRGIAEAIQCLLKHEQQSTLTISVVTQLELMVGCRNKHELQVWEKFMKRFTVIPLNEATSRSATDLIKRYRLSHGLLIPDALIAATALSQGIPLLTKNQRDYRFINGLTVLPYP